VPTPSAPVNRTKAMDEQSLQSQRRRGARRPKDVPHEVRDALERGAESANHMEQVAVDMANLLRLQIPELSHRAHELVHGGLVQKMRRGGGILFEELGISAASRFAQASSDIVRGWAAMAVGSCPSLSFAERLELIRGFADDPHFAVREWAWLSMRPHITAELELALASLTAWTGSDSLRIRRFASESTRPRGVWSTHIESLKRSPELALPILDPLRADESRYVQDSVANWLNDAAKTQPDWVRETCTRWSLASSASTDRICRRSLRSLS
jgi:3-methyladenine DNA glycosylase AlkC